MSVRDDYLLRFIALLQLAISDIVKYRKVGRYEAALHAAFAAQEKFFSRTTAELSKLSLDELLRLLRLDENKPAAREKVLGYASLLTESGLTYEAMGRAQLATGCYQLALQALLSVVAEDAVRSEELRERMSELLARIPPDELHEPVKEALRALT
jgi:tetratricopeptide (TPR) repeat protein